MRMLRWSCDENYKNISSIKRNIQKNQVYHMKLNHSDLNNRLTAVQL